VTPGGPTFTPTPEPEEFDSVIFPRRAQKIVLPEGRTEIIKKLRVKVANGDDPLAFGPSHTIRLAVSDGSCPLGTVLGVDLDAAPGNQDTVVLAPGKAKAARVLVRVTDAFTTLNAKAPARCTLGMRVLAAGVYNLDPSPGNNRVDVALDVIDLNDGDGTASHESVLQAKPVKIVIPPTAEGPVQKTAKVKVINADLFPVPELFGHAIRLAADDFTCPPGTVEITSSMPTVVDGGKATAVSLRINVDPDDFEAYSPKSPGRCTARLYAVTDEAANLEPLLENNAAEWVIDVYDKTDF
jgi:hypothetical protein